MISVSLGVLFCLGILEVGLGKKNAVLEMSKMERGLFEVKMEIYI